MRKKLLSALFLWLLAVPVFAAVVSTVAVPSTRTTGTTITASIWNSDVLGIYTYINNNIVPALNTVTTKGDMYVYNGASLGRLAVGTNNQILTADSGNPLGVAWAAFANAAALTTKGDILGYSTAATRIPVGTNGQVLVADSTQAAGIKWGTPTTSVPSGTVVAWSPAFSGTSTIPTGWLLCDGTSSTPNLIGKFIVGTRPTGSTAAAASGGYGVQTPDANGAGTTTHTHTISASISSGYPSATTQIDRTLPTDIEVSGYSHIHTLSYSGASAAASTEPSDYALVYIIKQ